MKKEFVSFGAWISCALIASPLGALISLPLALVVRLAVHEDRTQNLIIAVLMGVLTAGAFAVVLYRVGHRINGTSTPVALPLPLISQLLAAGVYLGVGALTQYPFFVCPVTSYFADAIYGTADSAPTSALFCIDLVVTAFFLLTSVTAYCIAKYKQDHNESICRLRAERGTEENLHGSAWKGNE